ncbi:CsbD family protein [Ottowia sp. GY511]|uniref:CsbD family protein n=1 Tax=Ottowia flava TaxID=2675430 RepID=A0ABW4KPD0_9BURK|nr:CsbD family protein [Ottowia sp. GY511]TXK26469.1 CsbD family protein [Ottowia sp. GY511]
MRLRTHPPASGGAKEKGTIKDNWSELKGKLQDQWPRLTDDDLEMVAGRRDQLVGKIQERENITAEQADRQVAEWQSRQGCPWG